MTGQEALCLVETLLQAANQGQRLNDVQSIVFRETWAGSSYREIAKELGYEHDYIKQVGSYLWRSISPQVGEKVSKRNIKSVLCRYQQSQTSCGGDSLPALPLELTSIQDWGEALGISQLLSALAEAEIPEEILPKVLLQELFKALESLKQRSLISNKRSLNL